MYSNNPIGILDVGSSESDPLGRFVSKAIANKYTTLPRLDWCKWLKAGDIMYHDACSSMPRTITIAWLSRNHVVTGVAHG